MKEFELTLQEQIISDIIFERVAQDTKWGDQVDNTDHLWTAILAEEFGEAAKEVLETGAMNGKLRYELIQCAAVCVAWIEALDRRNDYGS